MLVKTNLCFFSKEDMCSWFLIFHFALKKNAKAYTLYLRNKPR